MSIRIRCPQCRQLLSVATRKLGQTVKCPGCGAEFLVKGEAEADEGFAASEARADFEEPAHRERSDVDEEPAISIRRAETEFEEMDLTPMVDVTFLLLIFFMITASFSVQKTIEVPAPDPSEQGASQSMRTLEDFEANSVIVEIQEDNTIYIDDEKLTDVDRLADTLLDKRRADRKSELTLTADPRSFHETVVAVVDAANQAGFEKIRLATTAGSNAY